MIIEFQNKFLETTKRILKSHKRFLLKRVLPVIVILLIILFRIESQDFGGILLRNERKLDVPTRAATIRSIDKPQVNIFDKVTIRGNGFGEIIDRPVPHFPGKLVLSPQDKNLPKTDMYIIDWTNDQISFAVPADSISGQLSVIFEKNGRTLKSNEVFVGVSAPKPRLKLDTSIKTMPASLVTIKGENLGTKYTTNPQVDLAPLVPGKILINEEESSVLKWDAKEISFVVPNESLSGALKLIINRKTPLVSNEVAINIVAPSPKAISLNTPETSPTEKLEITGENFGSYLDGQSDYPGAVYFNDNRLYIDKWSDTKVTFFAPDKVGEGKVKLVRRYKNQEIATISFDLRVKSAIPKITSVNPAAITPGSLVMVDGTNFSNTIKLPDNTIIYPGDVYFSEDSERNINQARKGEIVDWSNNYIKVFAPLDITKALVYVRLHNNADVVESNVSKVKVNSQQPKISAIKPQIVKVGGIVTLNGINFSDEIKTPKDGHISYPGRIFLNGVQLTPLADNWSNSHVSFYIPPRAKGGKVWYETNYGERIIRSNSVELKVVNSNPRISSAKIERNGSQKILVVNGGDFGFQTNNPSFIKQLPGKIEVDGSSTYPVLQWNNYEIKVDVSSLNIINKVQVTIFNDSDSVSNIAKVSL